MDLIVKPVITEKSMKAVQIGKFTFIVNKSAGKNDIRKDVEKKFGVNVKTVSTTIVKGKTHKTGMKRVKVAISAWKKAIVELEKGQKIDLFELGA